MNIAGAAVLLAVVAIRFATPILDGDLFWHLAYAKQIVTMHSMVPDPAIYSWTPAATPVIYCAWLAELILYGLHAVAGLPALFAFRYLCVLAILGLVCVYARQRGAFGRPLTWLVLMLFTLGSANGSMIKPEIFSLVFFNGIVFAFFQFRETGNVRWLYAVPAVLLFWVNSHGGFIFAAPLLAAAAIGEAFRTGPVNAYRHMLIAWAFSAVAVMVTPYGSKLLFQLMQEFLLGGAVRPDFAWNAAYQPVWSPLVSGLHLLELGAAMAALLLLAGGRRWDLTLILVNLAYIPLFLVFVRTSFFWPCIFAYTFLSFPAPDPRPIVRAAAAALCLFFAGRMALEARVRPEWGSWLGFGTGYVNPVPEAEFLAQHRFPARLYNFYDSGGYLLWRLYPQYQVMIDSRAFPYLGFMEEEHAFERGEFVEPFLKRWPAEVAVVDLVHERAWLEFLNNPAWRPVFYGPTAAVFLKRSLPFDEPLRADPANLRSALTASFMFHFATAAGDAKTAATILAQLESGLRDQFQGEPTRRAVAYRDAHRALHAANWPRARELFDFALRGHVPGSRDQLIQVFLTNLANCSATEAATYHSALRKLAVPE